MPEYTWVSSPGTQAGSWRHRRLRKSAVSEHMIPSRPARDCIRLIRFLRYSEVLVWPAREWKILNKMYREAFRSKDIPTLESSLLPDDAALQWFFSVCTRKRSIRPERDEKEIMMSVTWCAPSRMNSYGRDERLSRRRNAAENVLHILSFWQKRASLDTIATNN